jgi:hypothetical protein
MTLSVAVLITALLFGGMTLYSFGFAAFLFTTLPAETAGLALRRAFPFFYLFVIVSALLASAFLWPHDSLSAALMALVAVSAVPTRQALMPAINRATDRGRRQQFKWLHGLSVVITLAHIAAAGFVLVRLV